MNARATLMLALGAAGLAFAGAAAAAARRSQVEWSDSLPSAGGSVSGGDAFFFSGYAPAEAPGDAGAVQSVSSGIADFVDGILVNIGIQSSRWLDVARKPENAQYLHWLTAAELQHAIPPLMLVRLAYQESRFRSDVISGQTVSPAGAVGIMQIVPRWHPGVDPLDARAAIDYAANYLAQLYRQFGTWELALQAYNWGPGNLSRFLRGELASLPSETAAYSRQILADAGAATGSVIV